MFSSRFDSSSKDTETISPTLMSPWLVLPESRVPPSVDLVDLVLKDEGEALEEDTSFEKDPSMDEEDLVKESF